MITIADIERLYSALPTPDEQENVETLPPPVTDEEVMALFTLHKEWSTQ